MNTAFGYHKYQIEEQHSISPLIRNKRRFSELYRKPPFAFEKQNFEDIVI